MSAIRLLSRSSINSISRINFRTTSNPRNYSKSVETTTKSLHILDVSPAELETSKGDLLNKFLIDHVLKNQSTIASASFTTLLKQLGSNVNLQLPYTLPYDNIGRKNASTKSDLVRGVVTIAHVLPSKDKVVIASGFAVLDGGLIVTCAHTFYQAALHLSSTELDHKAQSLVITHEGELIPIATVESHLVESDLVLLRLCDGRKITPLSIDPYPAPISTSLLSYNVLAVSLSTKTLPMISYSWESAKVLFYKGPCGLEANAGTYDKLSSMMYSHPPSSGSSGGPIVTNEKMSVVGIVRGNEVSYTNRKHLGFAVPSECLLEAFRLPGMPDGVQ